MKSLKYIAVYGEPTIQKVTHLINTKQLTKLLQKKYPKVHNITTDKALYTYAQNIKSQYLKKSPPLSKVLYDNQINITHNALGLHTYVSRVQGNKIKRKNEIKIGNIFKNTPVEFLRMIVVHELVHLKEKEHNKPFYKLCTHIEPNYGQYEFDMRLYMIHLEIFGNVWKS